MQNGKQERVKAGYHHGGVPCLLLCIPLYCAFRVNRCVRPYMAGTHVRREPAKSLLYRLKIKPVIVVNDS